MYRVKGMNGDFVSVLVFVRTPVSYAMTVRLTIDSA